MQLVVDGGRLEPPLGIPGYIYEKMLECWNTEPDARPTFDDLAGFFLNLATVRIAMRDGRILFVLDRCHGSSSTPNSLQTDYSPNTKSNNFNEHPSDNKELDSIVKRRSREWESNDSEHSDGQFDDRIYHQFIRLGSNTR